jgi:hypothetical protein
MPTPDTTVLTPADEAAFQAWARANRIPDVDHPDSHYDYRGFWKATAGAPHPPGSDAHFPDTFKQHGHPTFSQESQYSQGAWDGGKWINDTFLAQPTLAVSHPMPKTPLGPAQEAIRVLALHLPPGPAPLAPAPAPVLPAPTPEDRVLRGLMAVMGHGQIEHPAQATTIDALLGALHGRR